MKRLGLLLITLLISGCSLVKTTYQQPAYYQSKPVPAHLIPGKIYKVDALRP